MSFGNVKVALSFKIAIGDLVLFPVKDKIVLGILNKTYPHEAIWDDFTKPLEQEECLIIQKHMAKPSMGQFVGKTFDSFNEAVSILKEHRA
jgi:hypothetical protein